VAKGVALVLTSDEPAIATLTLVAGKHKVTKSSTLRHGATKVTLKLPARSRKALKAKRTVKSTLTVVATDAAGNTTTKTVTVTLKR
jgi:VCBS repeat-containing protein